MRSLREVEAFLDQNATVLARAAQSGARQKLVDAIAQMPAYVAEQSENRLESLKATRKHAALRRVLIRDHIRPIIRVARAELESTPELAPLAASPSGVPADQLVALAHGMARSAAPLAEIFTAAGLPADFLEQLTAAADATVVPIDDRGLSQSTRRGTTAVIKARLASARKVVGVLDAIVQTALKDDPKLREAWNGVKRVQQVGGGAPAAVTVPVTVPEPTSALVQVT